MDLEFRHPVTVASYDVDPFGELRVSTLMSFFQEAGRRHSQGIQLSVEELNRRNRTWVLAQFRLHYPIHPPLDAALQIVTWPSGRNEWDVVRDFEVKDAAGRTLALASGTYVIIDLTTRRATRLGDLVPADYQLPRSAFPTPAPLLPKLAPAEAALELPVQKRDLDVNFHVNNVVYVQWALETIPEDTWTGHRLTELEVNYRAEIRASDTVRVSTQAQDHPDRREYRHQVATAAGAEAARMRSTWRPRGPALYAQSLS